MKKIAVITARANSKSISRKNLQLVGGISLLARSVQVALESDVFDDIIVTTDGEEIAAEARTCGARVILRPSELATDDAKSIDAVCHALEEIGVDDGVCVLLQPTSPFRASTDIISAINTWQNQMTGSVIGVCECEHHPLKSMIFENDKVVPLRDFSLMETPRQILPKMYRPNGAIYVNRIAELQIYRTFFIPSINLHLMPPFRSIDIDSELDLYLARTIIGDIK